MQNLAKDAFCILEKERNRKQLPQGLPNMVEVTLALSANAATVPFIYQYSRYLQGLNAKGEETPFDARSAVGSEYSESKWVSERVIERTAASAGLRSVIIRLGRVCGSPNGAQWDVKEWVPSIIQSAKTFGLPYEQGVASWVPAALATRVVADVISGPTLNPKHGVCYAHLVHPRPVKWRDLAQCIASQLNVRLVSFSEWLGMLSGAAAEKEIPALRILPFFKILLKTSIRNEGREAFGSTLIDMKNMLKIIAIIV
ncbi:large subunit of alpha-aminoadipate reductase [Stygiomarasmius scandens]|uniref:Large subunit of alpha-aminoadipate reductase n=1 Tax=Marasmiellus scandens TaxID=2682957 RepID=A0ABR1K034_9AGAR